MIVLFGGEKGGTGKTTCATNVAAMRAASGRDVLLIDTDPQGSASMWSAIRAERIQKDEEGGKLVRVGSIQKFGKGLAGEIRDLAKRYDDVIIDAGGRESIDLRAALTVAQLAILPTQASQFDLWTIEGLAELIAQAQGFNPDLKPVVVISRASTNVGNADTKDAFELIGEYPGLFLANTVIRDRIAYRRAAGGGISVVEYGADAKASAEMSDLYNEIYEGEEYGRIQKAA